MRVCIRVLLLCFCLAAIPSLSHAAKTHKVKRSETIYSLARKYKVSVEDLKSANNLASAQVKKGDVLIIPSTPSSPAVASSETSGEDSKPTTYKVKRSEPLSRIAKRTGVSVSELKRLNNLSGKRVKAGQLLVLREENTVDEPQQRASKKYSLRYAELFNEKDYEQSLADLTESDPGKPVDLANAPELKTDSVKQLKSAAYGFLGTRYRFGGNSRSGLDCSAFVQQVFREMDVTLPRSAREQYTVGNTVSPGDLQKGDLVFFRTYASFPSHVGIYLGNNRMIHASSHDRRVVISSLNSNYYRSRYIGAKRITKINPDIFRFDDLLLGIEEETAEDAMKNDTLGTMDPSQKN